MDYDDLLCLVEELHENIEYKTREEIHEALERIIEIVSEWRDDCDD